MRVDIMNKIISEMDLIIQKSLNIMEFLKEHGMLEQEDEIALRRIRDKAFGAKCVILKDLQTPSEDGGR